MNSLIRERYSVVSEAARGGQGLVLEALDVVHGRRVALKVRPLGSEREQAAIFEEARILFGVRPHPNLPLLREDFADGDRYYLVMDWISGRDLRRVLREEGVPGLGPERVLDWLAQAAEAIDHLHDHDPPVVHGDVKPANLILAADGRVTLVDFGISSGWREAEATPRSTLAYAAPEVAVGGRCPASDVFSLAVTAYTLLSGSPPRPEVSFTPTGAREEAVPLLRALRRGLAIDPALRPASAKALVEALRAAVRPERRRRSRKARLLTTGAATGVAVAAVALAVARSGDRAPKAPQTGPPPLINIADGTTSCPEGYLCVWRDASYRGGGVGIYRREPDWRAWPARFASTAGAGSSFFNHGIPPPRERLGDVAVFTGPNFTGERVCIPNGGRIADAAGAPVDDAVRSNQWVARC